MIKPNRIVPILRIFDEAKAREFYVDFLGFDVAFEHRFGRDFPLYLGVVRGAVEVHLSEHHGDAVPGARVRIETAGNLSAWSGELRAARYRYAKPGEPEDMPWGDRELTLTDPFGNRLTFVEMKEQPSD